MESKSRIVFFKSAMHEALGTKDRNPSPKHTALYQEFAAGGAGVLMTGNVMVDRSAIAEPGNVVFDQLTNRNRLKEWAQVGTTKGNHIWVQLNHPGKSAPAALKQETVAPSAIGMGGDLGAAFSVPRALSISEIADLVEKFAFAAQLAKETGFTGVQIHGAHGYLINQFLSPADNQRTDMYGGSIENRMCFLTEIYQAIRKKVGKDFPIALKLNSSDFTPEGFSEEDSIQVIQKMAELGIDLIEISGGNYESQKVTSTENSIFFLDFAKKVTKIVDVPIVLTGGFKHVETMTQALEEDGLAMVGVARAMVLNPQMVEDIKMGRYKPVALPRLTTGIKSLDAKVGGLASISYYEQQMEKLATGKQPHFSTNAWSPLWHSLRR